MQHFSMLDLAPIVEGGSAAEALTQAIDLARHAETQGYHRYWLAEHHNMPGIASSATAVMIGQVAAATTSIRVGSGGIMLPNHAPLMVAEQFGTLATLFPNRIDLGLGRAPGTDMNTARALRRHMDGGQNFARDVVELRAYLDDTQASAVRAIPGEGTKVPLWILGSSLAGAELAAYLGLPFAFASHFAPPMLEQALALYRQSFQPSKDLPQPYAIVAAGVCAADTDEEAHFLRSSQMLGFARLRTGRPGKLPRPVKDLSAEISPPVMAMVEEALGVSAVGSPDTVHRQFSDIIRRYQPDELMVTAMLHDHTARVKSFALAANALKSLGNV